MNIDEKLQTVSDIRFGIEFYSKRIADMINFTYSIHNDKFWHKIEIYSMVIERLNKRLLKLLKDGSK